jgi:hypothetical protein
MLSETVRFDRLIAAVRTRHCFIFLSGVAQVLISKVVFCLPGRGDVLDTRHCFLFPLRCLIHTSLFPSCWLLTFPVRCSQRPLWTFTLLNGSLGPNCH